MEHYIMALGTFDGVHRGHTALLKKAVLLAKKLNINTAAFTFADHPLEKLSGQKVGLLCTLSRRIRLLKQAGADMVAVENFADIRDLSAQDFVQLLVEKYNVKGLVCGSDFRFGKAGAGDVRMLAELCVQQGLAFETISFVTDETGEKISSSRIREMIACGDMGDAAAALGRHFSIEGKVWHGKGLARTWHTPTINQSLPEELVTLRFGVYQSKVYVQGICYEGITNVGCRPTIDDGKMPNIETYILDGNFEKIDEARIEFIRFIRPEIKFKNEKSLQEQIQKDIQFVKSLK